MFFYLYSLRRRERPNSQYLSQQQQSGISNSNRERDSRSSRGGGGGGASESPIASSNSQPQPNDSGSGSSNAQQMGRLIRLSEVGGALNLSDANAASTPNSTPNSGNSSSTSSGGNNENRRQSNRGGSSRNNANSNGTLNSSSSQGISSSSNLLSRGGGRGDMSNKENDSPLPKYKRDLVQKMKVLRGELNAMQPQAGHCRLEVSREEIFEVRGEIYIYSQRLKFVISKWGKNICLKGSYFVIYIHTFCGF